MSGYMFAMAPCGNCRQIFSFNPVRVPSITPKGRAYEDRVPICEDCMRELNRRRVAAGLDPFAIMPGAYDVAEEGELG